MSSLILVGRKQICKIKSKQTMKIQTYVILMKLPKAICFKSFIHQINRKAQVELLNNTTKKKYIK